ncbi:hypothetical protein ARSEF4850_008977, partial [Beauveria asiatica]
SNDAELFLKSHHARVLNNNLTRMNPSTQRNQIEKSSQPDQDTYVRLLSDFTDDIENSVPTRRSFLPSSTRAIRGGVA